jgi:hypothetical protein
MIFEIFRAPKGISQKMGSEALYLKSSFPQHTLDYS